MKMTRKDKQIVERLSKEKYGNWISDIRGVLQQQDSPLSLTNGKWSVASFEKRNEMWKELGPYLFDDHLDSFKQIAVEVLKEPDPKFDLPADERFAASIHGKVLEYSCELRKGIAESLALMGTSSEALIHCSRSKRESLATLVTRDIFKDSNWIVWGSLNSLLPTLAEAAPGEFLYSVEQALRKDPCPFDELYAQEESGVFGHNYITGLLWALEALAWNEEQLLRVAVILGELASHDPGGNWANRPINSLTTILLPWHPQTQASIDKRIACIKAIRADFPDIAWRTLLDLLPSQTQTTFGAYKPKWRNAVPDDWKPTVLNKDYWEQVTAYAELAVEMAAEDLEKLKELVNNLDNLPKPSFNAALEHLSSDEMKQLPEEDRMPIWSNLIEFVGKHRRFSAAKWALDEETVSRIEGVALGLAPVSIEALSQRLFGEKDYDDLYEEGDDWQEQERKLEIKREDTIRQLFDAKGLDGVIKFVESVDSPYRVGLALGAIAGDEVDTRILPIYPESENTPQSHFTSGFVWSRFDGKGWEWVDGIDRNSWTTAQCLQLLLNLPFKNETWNRACNWMRDENLYWQAVRVNPYMDGADLIVAIDKLLDVSRPKSALECLYYRFHKKLPLDGERTIKALLDLVRMQETEGQLNTYHMTELIKALQDDPETDQNGLFNVEWAYLKLLDGHHGGRPRLLEHRLSTQADFFCELIRLLYRSKKEGDHASEPDEQKEAIASNAWRLLHEWKRPPGLRDDGTFSSEEFGKWLESVRQQCQESGHLEVAMINVGEVLFYCPADPDGLWIANEVARELDSRDSERMRRGFCTEIYNSRGAHCVDPEGKPEKELAQKWRQKADDVENVGLARFGASLRGIAESYERDAERIIIEHKREAEPQQDEGNESNNGGSE